MAGAKTSVKPHKKTESGEKRAPSKQKGTNTVSENRLELLFTVVGRSKSEYYADLIQSFEVNMQTTVMAHGTATAKMLGLLGLSDTDKAVIIGVIQENLIPSCLAALEEKFAAIKNGKGIAFTVPLTSVMGKLIFGFLSNNRMTVEGN